MKFKNIIFSIVLLLSVDKVFCQPVLMDEADLNYYKIEYELFGGENNPDNPEIVYVKNAYGAEYRNPEVYLKKTPVTLKNPVKDGYRFIYWFSNSSFLDRDSSEYNLYEKYNEENYNILQNKIYAYGSIKLYAKWVKTIDLQSYIQSAMVEMIPEGKKVTLENFAGTEGVQVINSFAMSKYEVTEELYKTVLKDFPSSWYNNGDIPVSSITFFDACRFCNELTKLTLGESECAYDIFIIENTEENITKAYVEWDKSKKGYRLPTVAEWEFAGRGGVKGGWNTNGYSECKEINKVAVYSNDKQPVGSSNPNAAGLYDMIGNVSEICWDLNPNVKDIRFKEHYIKGGDYDDTWHGDFHPWYVETLHYSLREDKAGISIGFRVVRSLDAFME